MQPVFGIIKEQRIKCFFAPVDATVNIILIYIDIQIYIERDIIDIIDIYLQHIYVTLASKSFSLVPVIIDPVCWVSLFAK